MHSYRSNRMHMQHLAVRYRYAFRARATAKENRRRRGAYILRACVGMRYGAPVNYRQPACQKLRDCDSVGPHSVRDPTRIAKRRRELRGEYFRSGIRAPSITGEINYWANIDM